MKAPVHLPDDEPEMPMGDKAIPDRGEMARRLLGSGRRFSPDRDAVAPGRIC